MAQQGSKYGLRTRFVVSKRQRKDALSSEELNQPAAKATIAAGLRPGLLTKAERLRFSTRAKEYLEARNAILKKWEADVCTFLAADACAGGAESDALIREAHQFLTEQGCINFGVPAGEPEPETGASDDALKEHLLDLLEVVDLDVWTEKKIRVELEKRLGISLAEKKAFIREHVVEFLESGGRSRKRSKKPASNKPAGKVIIVGAGPAGLAGGLHLKRCGVEVVVLEARDRVGGRVHTHQGASSSAAVDLGASIITGTETDSEKGLRPDPSAVVARQLGLSLHALVTQLPLYDGMTGALVAKESDARVEQLRDGLLDAARARVEELGEDAVAGESLGAAIDQALARLAKAPSVSDKPVASGFTKQRLARAFEEDGDYSEADTGFAVQQQPSGDAQESNKPGDAKRQSASAAGSMQASTMEVDAPLNAESVGGASSVDAAPASGTGQPGESAAQAEAAVKTEEAGVAEPGLCIEVRGEGGKAEAAGAATVLIAPPSEKATGAEAVPIAQPSEEANGQAAGIAELTHGAFTDSSIKAEGATAVGAGEVGGAGQAVLGCGDETGSGRLEQADAAVAGQIAQPEEGGDQDEAAVAGIARSLTEGERRLLGWHWANLEYGCSARLSEISLAHWNQDEEFGGFGGPHCMVRGGYGGITTALAARLDVQLSTPVASIEAQEKAVKVTTSSGKVFYGQAVVVTVPLGCLKEQQIVFQPALPVWKLEAIQKLGFGTLNKVVLEFPEAFWDPSQDYFGVALPEGPATRGSAGFTFWNLQSVTGAPQLTALVSGEAAYKGETTPEDQMRDAAVGVLRTLFGDVVSEPTSVTVTRWMSEEFSKGSYSYVAVGASAETYDQLAKPVHRRVLFAGEHTCKEHPDTVGGAMLTGMREAVRALHLLRGDSDEVSAAAAADVDTTTARKHKRAEGAGVDGGAKRRRKADGSEGKHGKRRKDDERESSGPEEWTNGRREGPPQRQAARTAEMVWQGEEQKEAARAGVKTVLRAVMEAAGGNVRSVVGCMLDASDTEARASLLQAMLIGSKDGQAAMAADLEVMGCFNTYLQDLLPDRPAFHVLELVLKVLAQLPVQFPVLKKSGVAQTVRSKLVDHPMRSIRTAAESLIQRWLAKVGPGAPELAPLQQKAEEKKPDVKPKAEPKEEEVEEDPEYAAQIELVRQEAEEAAKLARQYAEHAEAIEAQLKEAKAQGLAPLPSIEGFFEYAGANGKPRSSKSAAREDKLARRKQRAKEDVSGSAGSSATNGKHSSSGSYQARKEVGDYVTSLLKPHFASKRLSKEDYKAIAKSVVAKVMERRPAEATGLSSKESAKIEALVDKYVAQKGK